MLLLSKRGGNGGHIDMWSSVEGMIVSLIRNTPIGV